jgi:hypothetical protein
MRETFHRICELYITKKTGALVGMNPYDVVQNCRRWGAASRPNNPVSMVPHQA